MMRIALGALVGVLFGVSGCGNSSDDGANALGCADDEQPREAKFDLGENPRPSDSPEAAVERFIRTYGKSEVDGKIEETEADEADREFLFRSEGVGSARIFVTRLNGGWIVIGYEACPRFFR